MKLKSIKVGTGDPAGHQKVRIDNIQTRSDSKHVKVNPFSEQ